MDFFKLNKGEEAVVRFLYTEVEKIPIVKVHTVPIQVNGKTMSQQYKCNGDKCPLCEKYSKEEYIRVLALYDYTDNTVKCWKTANRTLINNIAESQIDWCKPINNLVFKIKRDTDEYGSYSISIMPEKNYPYPNGELEVGLDEDVSYRFGMYRSADEMKEYLTTGVMPKHVKSENSGNNNSWGEEYKAQQATRAENKKQVESVAKEISYEANEKPIETVKVEYTPVETTTTKTTFTYNEDEDFTLPF